MMILPMKLTLKLDEKGLAPISKGMRCAVWVYGVFLTIFTYASVVIGFFCSV